MRNFQQIATHRTILFSGGGEQKSLMQDRAGAGLRAGVRPAGMSTDSHTSRSVSCRWLCGVAQCEHSSGKDVAYAGCAGFAVLYLVRALSVQWPGLLWWLTWCGDSDRIPVGLDYSPKEELECTVNRCSGRRCDGAAGRQAGRQTARHMRNCSRYWTVTSLVSRTQEQEESRAEEWERHTNRTHAHAVLVSSVDSNSSSSSSDLIVVVIEEWASCRCCWWGCKPAKCEREGFSGVGDSGAREYSTT